MSDLTHLPPHIRTLIASSPIPFRATANHTHHTWARTYSSLPELYIRPQSIPEIEHAVRLAAQCRRRITTVGSGHSPSDLTCTSSWLVNLDDFGAILDIDRATNLVRMQAGIRLFQLSEELDAVGLAVPNLGSINEQSVAGVISTGTHGSSLAYGLLSERIVQIKIVLGDGKVRTCSAERETELFRAALLSLGALGVIVEVVFRAVPAFSVRWDQTIDRDEVVFGRWERGQLWDAARFVRVWWFPYMRRAVVWKGDAVPETEVLAGRVSHRDPVTSWYDGAMGYYVYHNLLFLGRYVPRILPWVEWFVFGMQYGFRNGLASEVTAVQPSRKALLMNCLYSQFVNEWAIPLEKGPEALRRLGSWLGRLRPGDEGFVEHGIPFSNQGLYVHSPVEVRVSDATVETSAEKGNRPWLDPTRKDGPTLYLNAIEYRPYHLDPGANNSKDRYYQGFEWLMRDLGGKPHWAKNFTASAAEVEAWYGEDLERWRAVRDKADPEGIFVGPWHRRLLLGGESHLENEEEVLDTKSAKGGGLLWEGRVGGEKSKDV
ncbi:sugar 1,4-lactone oxidase [Coniochaeta ligniaria NRRL 30616]|uniref:D-arabinono-1,4-lactone oxidase n=1 Tax=Coniochaeta ligniaria NRRL 30616 TaxID=1408157 RepID=A0A1J7IT22_9PEZI|nr:sugar 1,4-lactone oxidase [Coniochaeta ligniaria NRRL 30616]